MVRVTENGIIGTTFGDYIRRIREQFRNNVNSDISLEQGTPQGQIVGILAQALWDIDRQVVSLGSTNAISLASGRHLNDLVSLIGIARTEATRSTVTATLSGTVGTIIPNGSFASTTRGDRFYTTQEYTIASSNGQVSANMESEQFGPVPAEIGDLTNVVSNVPGWLTVNNDAPATPGIYRETDTELRARYLSIIRRNSVGSESSIRSAISEVEGVTKIKLLVNNVNASTTIEGVSTGPHSVTAIVKGGSDRDVARALHSSVASGIATAATQTHDRDITEDIDGTNITFIRPEEREVVITMATTRATGFPVDGVTQIRNAIIRFFNGLDLGQNVAVSELYGVIYSIPAHVVSSLTVQQNSNDIDGIALNSDQIFTVEASNITITLP